MRILCPTDFSGFSRAAWRHALGLARVTRADLELLHVYPLLVPVIGEFPYASVMAPLGESSRKRLFDDLEALAAEARGQGLNAKIAVIEGDPCGEILGRARMYGFDLIVMGTHGLRGFERWLLGSVAERVLVGSPCPVLTVGQPSEAEGQQPKTPPKRILCAIDLFGNPAATLEKARWLARSCGASLSVLHVLEGMPAPDGPGASRARLPAEEDYRLQLERRARDRFDELVPAWAEGVGAIEKILVPGRPHEGILRVAAERKPDLVVLGAHERRSLNVPVIGSTVRHVVRGACCPVLTVRPRFA